MAASVSLHTELLPCDWGTPGYRAQHRHTSPRHGIGHMLMESVPEVSGLKIILLEAAFGV